MLNTFYCLVRRNGKNEQNIFTCMFKSFEEKVILVYSDDTFIMSTGPDNWIYTATKKTNKYENIKDSNFKIQIDGKNISLFVDNILKERSVCSRKVTNTKITKKIKASTVKYEDTSSLW